MQDDLDASVTAAIPETARLTRTATREAPPTRIGRPRTSVSLLRTQSSTHSCRGRSALLCLCSFCRKTTERLNSPTCRAPHFVFEGRRTGGAKGEGIETPTTAKCGSGGGENAPKGSRRQRRGANTGRGVDGGWGAEIRPLLSSMPPAQRGRGVPRRGEAVGKDGHRWKPGSCR